MSTIFDRATLRPSQLRTVADRRFDDAEYLRRSRQNRHANGAMYVGGFVVECLLKAKLIEAYPYLQSPAVNRQTWSRRDRFRFDLCYRSHDLSAILAELPGLANRLQDVDQTGRLLQRLRGLCEEWTIFARYSPRTATISDAARLLDDIREIKAWLV